MTRLAMRRTLCIRALALAHPPRQPIPRAPPYHLKADSRRDTVSFPLYYPPPTARTDTTDLLLSLLVLHTALQP